MARTELSCETIVFRAARTRKQVNGERFSPSAFLLRENEEGLSVNYNCEAGECGRTLNRRYGVASLHVGRIKDIGLTVQGDDDGPPPHALILGLPPKTPEAETEAERIAGLLAEQSRTVINRIDDFN